MHDSVWGEMTKILLRSKMARMSLSLKMPKYREQRTHLCMVDFVYTRRGHDKMKVVYAI